MVFLYYFPWNDFYICTDPCVRLDRLIIIKIIGWFSRGLYGIDSNFEILISIYIIRCLGRCCVTVDLYMKITYAIGVGIVCQHIITGECRHTCSIVCTKFGIFFCNSTIYKVIGCPIPHFCRRRWRLSPVRCWWANRLATAPATWWSRQWSALPAWIGSLTCRPFTWTRTPCRAALV